MNGKISRSGENAGLEPASYLLATPASALPWKRERYNHYLHRGKQRKLIIAGQFPVHNNRAFLARHRLFPVLPSFPFFACKFGSVSVMQFDLSENYIWTS